MNRCEWPGNNPLMMKYHDEEWGVPLHDDLKIFEFMILDSFQAGLNWSIILNKRDNFRKAFDKFNPKKIAKYDQNKIDELMNNSGIIRNKLKIIATINNAMRFLEVQKQYGTFDSYIWSFVDHIPIINKWNSIKEIPAKSETSDRMSKDLIGKGFKFVGSTICYAFMQAAGMINDHIETCSRHNEVIIK
jgi:DNA-3-methyladenine glycosylase I